MPHVAITKDNVAENYPDVDRRVLTCPTRTW